MSDTLRDTVEEIVETIVDEIKKGVTYNQTGVDTLIHEESDRAIIYTDDCWDICKEWHGDFENLDRGMWEGSSSIPDMIQAIAYCILQKEVTEALREEMMSEFDVDNIDELEECEECGCLVNPDFIDEDIDGSPVVCPECLEKCFKECDDCSFYYRKEDFEHPQYCPDCAPAYEEEEDEEEEEEEDEEEEEEEEI